MNKELYQTDEWKQLDLHKRSQVLLVFEGLKRGAVYHTKKDEEKQIIEGLIRSSGFWCTKGDENTYVISLRENITKFNRRMEKNYLKFGKDCFQEPDHHRLWGWFYGYPDCCVEYYIDNKEKSARGEETYSEFLSGLDFLIRKKNIYPEFFLYRPIPFDPCGIGCDEAMLQFTKYMRTLNELDPEAGDWLKDFHIRNEVNKFKKDYEFEIQ
ncbi:DUF483 domain-containing protein [Nanoarchaeota archaeon]